MWVFTFAKVLILQSLLVNAYNADLRCPDNTQVDVTFFIDYVNCAGTVNWNKALQFVVDVIKQYKIGPNDARFAAVGYVKGAVTLYDIRSLTDYAAFEKALKGPGSQNGPALTDQVYNTILGWNMFSNKETARKSAQSVAVYIADGSSAYFNKSTNPLKSLNVKIVTIGIGSSVSVPGLKAQSSSPDDALLTASFDTLSDLKNKIIQRTCGASCVAYPGVTLQTYTNLTNQDCFKKCLASRQCFSYLYKLGTKCDLMLMSGAAVDTANNEVEVNPYISCISNAGDCLVYSFLRPSVATFGSHKDCFNSCVSNPKCLGYSYSKQSKYCGLTTLNGTVIDTKSDKSTSGYFRC
ncbi:collagen alpha-6(VI) chain-like [Physella acuta]|uniref:collagen alpha-6(VI) chain-like n=1 Tax=Physella acuta TaxID=109671 RepID=UPI0027DE42E3|nr:collagen alpha-6(VI) chain-like [Physella acuta]